VLPHGMSELETPSPVVWVLAATRPCQAVNGLTPTCRSPPSTGGHCRCVKRSLIEQTAVRWIPKTPKQPVPKSAGARGIGGGSRKD
jgi:hypothetical protein